MTQDLFRQGPSPNNVEELHALDGHGQWSPSISQTTVTYAYAQALLPLSDHLVSIFPQAELSPPGTFFEILDFLPSAYIAITKIPAERQEAYADAIAALDAAAAACLQDGRLTAVLKEMQAHDDEAMARLEVESKKPYPDIDLHHEAEVLASRRQGLSARRAAIEYFGQYAARLNSIRLWNAFVEDAADALERQMTIQERVLRRCGQAGLIRPG